VDISPKGDFVAVGMRDGTLRVFQTSTWKMVHLQKCGIEWIEDLKFSPDGKYLAVGSHDNKLYVFTMPDCKLFNKKFGMSSSFITHLDWSLDSQHIRTNDGSYELLYYNVESGTQIKSGATQFRNEIWATQSCVLGWATQGIW
jgi:WD40 repeat protein